MQEDDDGFGVTSEEIEIRNLTLPRTNGHLDP